MGVSESGRTCLHGQNRRPHRLLKLACDTQRTGNLATLGECQIARAQDDKIIVIRELGRSGSADLSGHIVLPITPGRPVFWDNRFEVLLTEESEQRSPSNAAFEIRFLGDAAAEVKDGLAAFDEAIGERWQRIPPAVRPTLPALFIDGHLSIVPHLSPSPLEQTGPYRHLRLSVLLETNRFD